MEEQRKRIWDNFFEVGEIRKSDKIKFIIGVGTRQGYRYVNIREFYHQKKSDSWVPGKDGITIPLIAPLNMGETFIEPLKDMYDMLATAAELAFTMELMDPEKAVWAERKRR